MKLNLKNLYEKRGGKLTYTSIVKVDDNCYDLVDEFGEIVAMDGDRIECVKPWDDVRNCAVLRNMFDGLRFEMTLEEMCYGIDISEEIEAGVA